MCSAERNDVKGGSLRWLQSFGLGSWGGGVTTIVEAEDLRRRCIDVGQGALGSGHCEMPTNHWLLGGFSPVSLPL